jgi:hypothetical protein
MARFGCWKWLPGSLPNNEPIDPRVRLAISQSTTRPHRVDRGQRSLPEHGIRYVGNDRHQEPAQQTSNGHQSPDAEPSPMS